MIVTRSLCGKLRRVISLRDLTKTYGAARAVDSLSLDVAPGEIVGLIGPNGAGKTSALRCIAGIHRPSSGSVLIGGRDIVRDPVEAKRRIAFVGDEPHLFEHLTVTEHLRLTGRIYGVTDADARANEWLKELELTGRETAIPSELSRGMKQKVALACALLHDPQALVLDEPLTGLDPLGIHRMKRAIVACAGRGVAVLVSSHLLHLVEELCTRIVIINHGVKVADGTLAELASQARLAGSTLERIFLDVTGHGSVG
jgi:ABC-2 type transport system ATP-binding protein